MVAEKEDVYKKFPIPLINRLEKHSLATSNMLSKHQMDMAGEVEEWAKDFATPYQLHVQTARHRWA